MPLEIRPTHSQDQAMETFYLFLSVWCEKERTFCY